ncbi:MAG: carboxyltransferase domain-containing protein [Pseudomonadota bacterium]
MDTAWPAIRTAGFDGFVVSFGDALTEPANRAALAFRDALEASGLEGVEEISSSLVSAFLRFDPLSGLSHADMQAALQALLDKRDWYEAPLPRGRRLWRVPAVIGGDAAPQFSEAAAAAGYSEAEAVASIARQRVRVQTIGFSPGVPYLGQLSPEWDIPRRKKLNPQVPAGSLCVAIRQLIVFSVAMPTGWTHIGQTALNLFRPASDTPFLVRSGDEFQFRPVSPAELADLQDAPDGGATHEPLP